MLTQLEKGTHTPLHLIKRAQIVLRANMGWSNNTVESALKISSEKVKLWRDKYSRNSVEIMRVEEETPQKLRATIIEVLSDERRPGAPTKFKDGQVAAIIALSCEDHKKFNLSFSHWTPEILHIEAIKLGIIEDISIRYIERFLKRKRFKPNQSKGWLNPNIEDIDQFQASVTAVSGIYFSADVLT